MVFKNLRSIREDRDIRQREIAELLHISQNTYSQYETGAIALTGTVKTYAQICLQSMKMK